MKKTLIQNGYLVDPGSAREGLFDLLIEDGIVKSVSKIRKSGRNTPEGRVRADFSKTWCKPLYGERSRLK